MCLCCPCHPARWPLRDARRLWGRAPSPATPLRRKATLHSAANGGGAPPPRRTATAPVAPPSPCPPPQTRGKPRLSRNGGRTGGGAAAAAPRVDANSPPSRLPPACPSALAACRHDVPRQMGAVKFNCAVLQLRRDESTCPGRDGGGREPVCRAPAFPPPLPPHPRRGTSQLPLPASPPPQPPPRPPPPPPEMCRHSSLPAAALSPSPVRTPLPARGGARCGRPAGLGLGLRDGVGGAPRRCRRRRRCRHPRHRRHH